MPEDRQAPKPNTPRGVEPRARRANDGAWTWRYRVRWTDPTTGARKAEEFDTIGEAEDFRAHLRLARRRGVLEELTRGEVTLQAFIETTWWPKYAAKNLERGTLETYAPPLNKHLIPRMGNLQLRQLTAPAVQKLREDMEDDGIGAPTVRRVLAILQGICSHAVTSGEMLANPVREVRKPAVTRQRAVVVISPAQIEKLIRVLAEGYPFKSSDGRRLRRQPDPVSATLVSVLAYEGLRPEEALALQDRHIRARTLLLEQKNVDGQIIVGQKGRRASRGHRTPELFPPVAQDLKEHLERISRPARCELVFPRPDGAAWRKHHYANWRADVFKPAVKAAGLPINVPYDLRHSSASILLAAGWPLPEAAAHLGNSVQVLSDTYAHIIADLKGTEPVPVAEQITRARAARQERP